MTGSVNVNLFLLPPCKNLLYITAHVMSNFFDFSQPLPSKKISANPKLTDSVNPNSYICGMSTSRNILSMLA
jgi:hypothetical protein